MNSHSIIHIHQQDKQRTYNVILRSVCVTIIAVGKPISELKHILRVCVCVYVCTRVCTCMCMCACMCVTSVI